MKRRKKKILGNDRGLMMLCRDARRRWLQYGENRKNLGDKCTKCNKRDGSQIDHIDPLGPRPRRFAELPLWLTRMFYDKCQLLCDKCHQRKTKKETKIRRNK